MRGVVRTVAGGVGFWLLIDLLRVWAPSLITIFGQAASTPPEAMGGFALAVVLAGCLPVLLVRVPALPDHVLLATALLGALACRIALQIVGGGGPQLWWASAGVAFAVAWSCLAARCRGDRLVQAFAVGMALATTTHAALGTWGAVWRDDVWAWLLLAVQAGLVLGALAGGSRGEGRRSPAPRGLALALLPGYLVAGVWAANPARASATVETWGPVTVAVATVAAVALAWPGTPRRVPAAAAGLAGLGLMAGTAGTLLPATASPWSLPAYVVGLPTLVVVLRALAGRAAGAGRTTPTLAAAGGAVLWVVLFFAYYAGYDLGYRADWLLVVVAAVLGGAGFLATLGRPHPEHRRSPGRREDPRPVEPVVPRRRLVAASAVGGAAVLAGVTAALGPQATIPSVAVPDDADDSLTVVAWNLRMGYGMDGTFEPAQVARLIAEQEPDIVLLSEVDRGWLLNGGQDQLEILAVLLGMDARFGPAADPVWGDAVLTDLPVTGVDTHPLPSHGAVTGAQALAVNVSQGGRNLEVVSTHVQPHPVADDADRALAQARDIADLVGRPGGDRVVLGGDFNLRPGDPSWEALLGAGLHDALSGARPAPTSPADDPRQQIDHVLVSDGLAASDPRTVPTLLSDHLPVVVTLVATG